LRNHNINSRRTTWHVSPALHTSISQELPKMRMNLKPAP
jgi:hypothetical protein